MDYSIDGVEDPFLREAGQAIEFDIASLQSSGKPAKEIESQINKLNELHLKIKQGELYGLIHAASYLVQRLPELDEPRRGDKQRHKKQKWSYDDLKEFVALYGDEESPYMVLHDQTQLTAMGEQLEKKVGQWERDKLIYECVVAIIRAVYFRRKCELLEKHVNQLQQRVESARRKEFDHGNNSAKGRQKRYAPRDALYARVTFNLRTELNRELMSTDYREWRKRVLSQEDELAESTLRTAFERETSCKPTTKSA